MKQKIISDKYTLELMSTLHEIEVNVNNIHQKTKNLISQQVNSV